MKDSGIEGDEKPGSREHGHFEVFCSLTDKQRQVLHHVAENRTTKEIAHALGISESAVNQRIEGVRGRTGSPPRSELARSYRLYLQQETPTSSVASRPAPSPPEETSSAAPLVQEDGAVAPPRVNSSPEFGRNGTVQSLGHRVVPKALDGPNAGLTRVAAITAIAVGMLLVAMVGLGVVRALTQLF